MYIFASIHKPCINIDHLIVIDKLFNEDNVMEALADLEAWETFYFTLTGKYIYKYYPEFEDNFECKKQSFVKFRKDYPGKISWKNVAEAVYLCCEEKALKKLSNYVRSPEGKYDFICQRCNRFIVATYFGFTDPTLSFRAVEALLDNEKLTQVHFAGLNAELGVPLLVKKCSNTFGVRLWLLSDPTVSWADLAVALYSIHSNETDVVLSQLMQKYLPNTGNQLKF